MLTYLNLSAQVIANVNIYTNLDMIMDIYLNMLLQVNVNMNIIVDMDTHMIAQSHSHSMICVNLRMEGCTNGR